MNIHSNARTCPASRALLVRRVREMGWQVEEAASAAGISVRRAYAWLARAREPGGSKQLIDRSSRPRRLPTQTRLRTEKRIIALRMKRMTVDEIAERVAPSRSTVARILRRAGLSRLRDLEPKQPPRRYEYPNPGGLLHLDIKRLGRIVGVGKRFGGRPSARRAGWEYVHLAIDDHSRVAYVEVLPTKTARCAIAFLERALAWFSGQGVNVVRVMTDNGSCYIAHDFAKALRSHNIRHIRIKPYRPQTNGKAERLVQTVCREWAYRRPYTSSRARTAALERWLSWYNQRRPHTSLGRKPPISRLETNR